MLATRDINLDGALEEELLKSEKLLEQAEAERLKILRIIEAGK